MAKMMADSVEALPEYLKAYEQKFSDKQYEYIKAKFDPLFGDLVAVTETVKDFIRKHKLIIYGGTAIDYALRLKGDNIYPDDALAVPDLDFYSPTNIEHAYQLADELYDLGYKESRAITGEHVQTMRVDVASNHFIADISYKPKSIFDRLPYLIYDGMRIIHPLAQRIDVHGSLSFPYDDSPREVIFARWKKDIERFNKLAVVYPAVATAPAPSRPLKVNMVIRKYVLTGFAAYALIYRHFAELCRRAHKSPKGIISANFSVADESIIFDSFGQIEIVHFNMDKAAEECELGGVRKYDGYSNLILKRVEGNLRGAEMAIYSTKDKLIAQSDITVDGVVFRTVAVQPLLMFFLGKHFASEGEHASTYLAYYVSLMNMIAEAESLSGSDLFYPVITTYGSTNLNLARKIALNRMYAELAGAPRYKVPKNYYPDRTRVHPPVPDCKFFREEGARRDPAKNDDKPVVD